MGDFDGAASSSRLRQLIPVTREYAPQLRDFGTVLVARLTEKNISRGLNWASLRLKDSDSGRRFAAQSPSAVVAAAK